MATLHATRIDERLPARILRRSDADGHSRQIANVTARRFMDVLFHPVPPLEMQDECGVFRQGGKIFVEWPEDSADWMHAAPTDRLEVEGREFDILAIHDAPPCYSTIYVEQPAI
jgi:hypothetical protein